MKESTSAFWIFNLIITFIFIFTGFIIVSINYSRAYKVKNEVLNIIEKYEGYTASSRTIINNYLHQIGYKEKGKCHNYANGEDDLMSTASKISASGNRNNYYCINRKSYSSGYVLYEVKLFFNFNLPIFGELTTFSVTGKTDKIKDFPDYVMMEVK